jgi:hypothetical protein
MKINCLYGPMISLSLLTTSNHFPGGVFFGGAMGFVIARYIVLPNH